jgi:hypothetical protein
MSSIEPVSEDYMISVFLKAEIESSRFRDSIITTIKLLNTSTNIVLKPNITSKQENIIRKEILERTRCYISKKELFVDFPSDFKWYLEEWDTKELLRDVQLINSPFWMEVTQNTRNALIGAKHIESNKTKNYAIFNSISKSIKCGEKFQPLILVSDNTKYIVLEGHLRIIGYAMNLHALDKSLAVITGYSDKLKYWQSY